MTTKKISMLIEEEIISATLDYDEYPAVIRLTLADGWEKQFTGQDLYECLGKILKELPEANFLCKGAKLNVRPSAMSSQMTSGIMAYEHTLGARVGRKNIVNIFDYEDQNIVNDPQLQTDFFYQWLESLRQN